MLFLFVNRQFRVPFEELTGSPTETHTLDTTTGIVSVTAKRQLKCTSSNYAKLLADLGGYIEYRSLTTVFHGADWYGHIDDGIRVVHVDAKPYGKISASPDDTKFASYPHVILDVIYKTTPPSAEALAYGLVTINERLVAAGEFITLNTKGLYWGTGGAKEAIDPMDAPSIIAPLMEWSYEISGASLVPEFIFSHVGKVNATGRYSQSLNFTFPAQTLLYVQPSIEYSFKRNYGRPGSDASKVYRIALRFLYRPGGWNIFPRVSAAGSTISWEPITDGTDNKDFYPLADFNEVFVP